MELKPTQAVLDQIEQAKDDARSLRVEQAAQEARQLQRQESLVMLRGFEGKMKLPTRKTSRHYYETVWVDIEDDDTTVTTLQARLTYKHTPKSDTDPEFKTDESTFYDLQVRYVEPENKEISSTVVTLAQICEYDSKSDKYLVVNAELGLEEGRIDLTGHHDIEPGIANQVVEIEQEILNPLVEALKLV